MSEPPSATAAPAGDPEKTLSSPPEILKQLREVEVEIKSIKKQINSMSTDATTSAKAALSGFSGILEAALKKATDDVDDFQKKLATAIKKSADEIARNHAAGHLEIAIYNRCLAWRHWGGGFICIFVLAAAAGGRLWWIQWYGTKDTQYPFVEPLLWATGGGGLLVGGVLALFEASRLRKISELNYRIAVELRLIHAVVDQRTDERARTLLESKIDRYCQPKRTGDHDGD